MYLEGLVEALTADKRIETRTQNRLPTGWEMGHIYHQVLADAANYGYLSCFATT
jgi:hypothetical protein